MEIFWGDNAFYEDKVSKKVFVCMWRKPGKDAYEENKKSSAVSGTVT